MSARRATPYVPASARGFRALKKRGTVKEPHHLVVIRLPWLDQIRRRPQSFAPVPMSEPPRAYAPMPTLAGDDARRL